MDYNQEQLWIASKMSRKLLFVPGPTTVHPEVRQIYSQEYLSSDLEEDFFQEYSQVGITVHLLII